MNRAILLGPVVFALAGAGVAISLGMLSHNEPPYRVHLDDNMPLMFLGVVLGTMVGCGVSAACARRPRLIRPAGLASVALLGAAITAPLGWIAGSGVASERLPRVDVKEQVQHLPRVGMGIGAVVGGAVGLALGGAQMLLDRRRPAGHDGSRSLGAVKSR